MLALKNEMPVQVTPYMLNAPAEAPGSTFTEEMEPEEDDDDWEGWEFREQRQVNQGPSCSSTKGKQNLVHSYYQDQQPFSQSRGNKRHMQ